MEECERGFDTLVVGAFLSFLGEERKSKKRSLFVLGGRMYLCIYVCVYMTAEYISL